MKISGDFHTHTTYSHGLGSVEENVKQAENLQLKSIAITEHAYKANYAIKKGDQEKIHNDILAIKDKYKVNILWGIEANLISRDGDIDVSDEELKDLDLVILGYHKLTKVGFKEFFKFSLPNILCIKPTKKQRERNTKAYLKALDKHRVSIIAHLQYGKCYVNVKEIATECAKRNIYIELNGKRINFSKQDIKDMLDTDVMFIIDSDAHHPLHVGKNHRAFNLIEKYNIPLERIANINGKIPKFN